MRPVPHFAPVFEKASEAHPDVVFGKVDTEAEQALAGAAGISSIPTLMAFRDGMLLYSQPGALPAAAARAADQRREERSTWTEVHAQIAAQKAGASEA